MVTNASAADVGAAARIPLLLLVISPADEPILSELEANVTAVSLRIPLPLDTLLLESPGMADEVDAGMAKSGAGLLLLLEAGAMANRGAAVDGGANENSGAGLGVFWGGGMAREKRGAGLGDCDGDDSEKRGAGLDAGDWGAREDNDLGKLKRDEAAMADSGLVSFILPLPPCSRSRSRVKEVPISSSFGSNKTSPPQELVPNMPSLLFLLSLLLLLRLVIIMPCLPDRSFLEQGDY